MKAEAYWSDWDGNGLDRCTLEITPDGLTLSGTVTGAASRAVYRVETDARFRTRSVRLHAPPGPGLALAADGRGHWTDTSTGRPVPGIEGCIDVDLALTPATNTLPIRRLSLAEGTSGTIAAAYLGVPGPGGPIARRAAQRYTCLAAGRRYLYEGLESGFSAEIAVDAAGLVLDYPGAFRRLGGG